MTTMAPSVHSVPAEPRTDAAAPPETHESDPYLVLRVNPYLLMRVRVRHHMVGRLEELAEYDSQSSGRRVFVADLVRDAIREYVQRRVAALRGIIPTAHLEVAADDDAEVAPERVATG